MKAIAVLALLALVAMTGVRATEVESTEVADIDFDDLEAENDTFLEVDAEGEDEESDEAEDESEEESEEEDEAEDESEEESEEEADSLAETDAETLTDAEFESELAASIGENARGKWHVYSNVVTETAHEGISALALGKLATNEKAKFNAEKLRVGVIWNDMPVGVDNQLAKAVNDGHMDVDTWTRLFFTTGGVNDLVFNVHYGCLQHWHSMAPIQRVEAKNPAGGRIVFTNDQVRAYTIAQIKQWWNKAVASKSDAATSSWYMGHILHTVQDSYPRGHTVRVPNGCGAIISFQGYDAQHGNGAHKTADYSPSNKNKESDSTLQDRYNCAVSYSSAILKAFAQCALASGSCADSVLDATLNTVYTMANGAGAQKAGGSASYFAKAGIAQDPNYESLVVEGITLYNPKSNKFAGNNNKKLCDGSGAIQSKTPSGLGFYNSGPYTDFINPSV